MGRTYRRYWEVVSCNCVESTHLSTQPNSHTVVLDIEWIWCMFKDGKIDHVLAIGGLQDKLQCYYNNVCVCVWYNATQTNNFINVL